MSCEVLMGFAIFTMQKQAVSPLEEVARGRLSSANFKAGLLFCRTQYVL